MRSMAPHQQAEASKGSFQVPEMIMETKHTETGWEEWETESSEPQEEWKFSNHLTPDGPWGEFELWDFTTNPPRIVKGNL
jgi:hypothetical protein